MRASSVFMYSDEQFLIMRAFLVLVRALKVSSAIIIIDDRLTAKLYNGRINNRIPEQRSINCNQHRV